MDHGEVRCCSMFGTVSTPPYLSTWLCLDKAIPGAFVDERLQVFWLVTRATIPSFLGRVMDQCLAPAVIYISVVRFFE